MTAARSELETCFAMSQCANRKTTIVALDKKKFIEHRLLQNFQRQQKNISVSHHLAQRSRQKRGFYFLPGRHLGLSIFEALQISESRASSSGKSQFFEWLLHFTTLASLSQNQSQKTFKGREISHSLVLSSSN